MVEIAEGQVLEGKYRVDRVIGRGGMGIVVAARHLVLDETVAIKFLSEEALANGEAVARFEREARAAVKIKNEHVVRVFDVGRLPSGPPYMVMEYLEGEDLATRLAQGPLPVAEAVDFVLQACVALAAAHAAGIVHRDIKPGNLFCQQGDDGKVLVKVLDFGISKLADALGDRGMSVTKTSAVMGSPLYMSPEQVQNAKGVDGRTDIWALGVVLFEAISGRVPFKGETFGEVVIQIATQPTPGLTQFRRDVPPGLDAVVARCLEKDRGQRISSVAELAHALQPFASRRGQAAAERIANIVASSSPSLRGPRSAPLPLLAQSKVLAGDLPETAAPWSKTGTRRDNRRAIVGTIAAAALGLAALSFVLLRRGVSPSPEPSSTPGSAELAPLQTAAPSQPSALLALPGPASPPASVVPLAAASTPSLAETAKPAPEPLPTRGTGRSRRPSSPAATAATVERDTKPSRAESTGAAAPAPAPAATNPDCDPPYTLDEQGRKKFKRECFLK